MVRDQVRRQPSFTEFTAGVETGRDLMQVTVPVTTPADGMEYGQWRLAGDDGVIAEGKIDGRKAAPHG